MNASVKPPPIASGDAVVLDISCEAARDPLTGQKCAMVQITWAECVGVEEDARGACVASFDMSGQEAPAHTLALSFCLQEKTAHPDAIAKGLEHLAQALRKTALGEPVEAIGGGPAPLLTDPTPTPWVPGE